MHSLLFSNTSLLSVPEAVFSWRISIFSYTLLLISDNHPLKKKKKRIKCPPTSIPYQ